MKNLLLSLIFSAPYLLFSQWVNNGGFENWTTGDPAGWQSPNQYTFGTNTVTKETVDVYAGVNSAKLESKSVFGYPVPGILTNGKINVNLSGNPPVTISGGFYFNLKPDNLIGYYKYAPSGGDFCYVWAYLLKVNLQTNLNDTVASAQFSSGITTNSWTSFTAPFNYTSSDTPDSIQITIVSSDPAATVVGSVLKVDDIDLSGGNLGVAKFSLLKSVNIYPNPVTDLLYIHLSRSSGVVTTVTFYSLVGQKVKEINLPAGTEISTVNLRDMKKGMYFIQIQSGKEKYLQKLSVN